ncbi:MAG: hypothetical protein GXO50_09770 [Chlorobi bacterium]|nr:hypothetical protein [Chlorobiota bacterium]
MIDYIKESEKFRPDKIKTLLVAEAPPPSGQKYFYVPEKMNPGRNIENYSSLPATVFYHYFKSIPGTKKEYLQYLDKLKEKGVFLTDIIDKPLKIRDKTQKNQINKKNLEYLILQIPLLRNKLKQRQIIIDDKDIVFLLARNNYIKHIRKEFPESKLIRWKDFRMNIQKL